MASESIQYDLIPAELDLPPLEIDEKFNKVGRISCRLSGETKFVYAESEKLPRRTTNPATLYRDASGARILVTTTTADGRMSDCRGILLRKGSEERWLHHDDLKSRKAEILGDSPLKVRDEIRESWANQFVFKSSESSEDGKGLRPPQIGALHAVLAHWSLTDEPATVVMPTGTGKTETMLSLLVAARSKCVLVVVPSKALREQMVKKFSTLGILPGHGIVTETAKTPVVGAIEHELRSKDDLEIFDRCNVVVAVVNSVANGKSVSYLKGMAERCSHLVFDEAHHVPAGSWSRLKDAFKQRRILQFTATPFREDRSPIGGKVIYNYPLKSAQDEGYFLPITFDGVFEIDRVRADERIAKKAISHLRSDLAEGFEHRLMARCKSIDRAEAVLRIYKAQAPDLSPIIVHSKDSDPTSRIEDLRAGKHKIVVTVDMLKEGFDMPELKVAAVHDTFKSLAVTLQFAGRFPRVGGDSEKLGTPTIVANTGFEEIKSSLQGLYDEDADWNQLLSDLSFEKVAEGERFEEFLHSSQDLSDGDVSEDSIAGRLNKNSLTYKFNTVVYRNAKSFNQFGIRHGLEARHRFVRAWENNEKNVVFFVTRFVGSPEWTKSNKTIEDSILYLFVAYHDPERELLYIGSSFKSASGHSGLARALSGDDVTKFQDEEPYRVFEGVEHLVLHQVGLLSGGGARNVRYSMFSGADVKVAIERIISSQSTKSNVYGVGFRDGRPIDLGCSKKGKVWRRGAGSLNEWKEWCDSVGTRLLNKTFDTSQLISQVLIPEPIDSLPDKEWWFFEWPEKLSRVSETSVRISAGDNRYPFHLWVLILTKYDKSSNTIEFEITYSGESKLDSKYELKLVGGDEGFEIKQIGGPELSIVIGNQPTLLTKYLYEYPPILTFIDQSAMEGARLVDPAFSGKSFDEKQCEVRDWSQTDIRRESRWKDGGNREDSIQAQAMRWCRDEGFDIVFDDDGANEIADIVAIREESDSLLIRLLHCKYSSEDGAGARVKDIVEVTSQATKNFDWLWDFKKLARRMMTRHADRSQKGAGRFIVGSPMELKKLVRLSAEFRRAKNEVIVVQPGVAYSELNDKMKAILGSADSFLRVRANCGLDVWCS